VCVGSCWRWLAVGREHFSSPARMLASAQESRLVIVKMCVL
jgi:hypothetical protein